KGRDAHTDEGAERKIDETANHRHVLGGRAKRGVDAVGDRSDHAISKDDHDGGAHEEPGALLERLPPEPNCRSRREAHAANLSSTRRFGGRSSIFPTEPGGAPRGWPDWYFCLAIIPA